jgi:prepilin peptidase CpaA
MIVESLVPFLFVGAFLALVLVAAASDIRSMLIPNWVSIALALAFLPAAWTAQMSLAEIGLHAATGLVVFLAGFALFALGVLGGGDVKVIAAASVWTGTAALSPFAFWTTAAGGVLALAMLLARRSMKPADTRPAFLNRLLDPAKGIPYAVAIAVGAIVSLPAQPVAQAAFR